MTTIRIKKGYDLNMTGAPSPEVQRLSDPDRVALVPAKIPFIKPRLKVETGDTVRIGSPLVEDKREPAIRLLSPGGGKIVDIRFGPRRIIEAIEIELDADEPSAEFTPYDQKDIEKLERQQLVLALVEGGCWPLIKELPFRDYPLPDKIPPAIYVSLDNLEPFNPRPEVFIKDKADLLSFGLTVLKKLSEDRLVVCAHESNDELIRQLNGAVNLSYSGVYPAHDPGVLLYHTKTSAEQNHAWFVDAQDVLFIAELLKTGGYPTRRMVTVAGSAVRRPGHMVTRLGIRLSDLAEGAAPQGDVRFIEGGVLSGFDSDGDSYLSLAAKSLNILPEGNRPGEFLRLFRPGYRKPTFSRAFTSKLTNAALEYDCNMHGGDRACIACGYCALVCPVDILPQFTYKSVLAGEVEESLQHGLLDCVECGLCSYVCPSKIDLLKSFKNAKADHYKELGK